jgi:hypothetical protein
MKSKKSQPGRSRKNAATSGQARKVPKSFPPVAFLVCPRRKNKPKIQIVVCEKRCREKGICPAYYAYVQPGLFKGSAFSAKRRKAADGTKPPGKRA